MGPRDSRPAIPLWREGLRDFGGRYQWLRRRHEFDWGFTAGGPLRIPKLYNGRDKTFFQLSYEGFRNRVGARAGAETVQLYLSDPVASVTRMRGVSALLAASTVQIAAAAEHHKARKADRAPAPVHRRAAQL